VCTICCGTRRVLAAALDSAAVSEQALWDRLTDRLRPGMLLLAEAELLLHEPLACRCRNRR
jgi:hypothetical protein